MTTDYILSAKRFMDEHLNNHRRNHIEGVISTAEELARIYGVDVEKAHIAAFFHDIAKYMKEEESDAEVKKFNLGDEFLGNVNLAHGRIAGAWAKEYYGVTDEDILNAITYHTSSRKNSSLLEKIIFVADTVEPGRTYDGAKELLERSKTDLFGVYEFIVEWMMDDLEKKGIEPGRDTIDAYKEINDGK